MKEKPNKLSDDEIMELLNVWFKLFQRIESAYEDLRRTLGVAPEAAVVSIMYDMHREYTKLVAEQVEDKGGVCLDWYIWENGGGKKGREAKAASWKKARKIKTLKDLAALLRA